MLLPQTIQGAGQYQPLPGYDAVACRSATSQAAGRMQCENSIA